MDVELKPYQPLYQDDLVALWELCELTRSWNDPYRDIERKLLHDGENLLILEKDGELIGSIMIGYDGHRGWINFLAVHPNHRSSGFGRLLVEEAKNRLEKMGCAKLNLQVRSSNEEAVDFYRHIGFVVDDVVGMGIGLQRDATSQ
ncbi:MAG: GNAT family acetyltransferase [Acidimicrobiales bacterium]